MSFALKVMPSTMTLIGVMSTVIVEEPLVDGSTPTMFQPYVTPSSGFADVRKKWVRVFVVDSGFAPPIVVVIALSWESLMTGIVLAVNGVALRRATTRNSSN